MQRLTTVIIGVGLAACARTTVQYVATNPPPRPMAPRPAETVEIYATAAPPRPFLEVGIIQARQNYGDRDDLPRVIQAIRVAAARRGCDAVLLNGPSNMVSNQPAETEGFWGACIQYTSIVASPTP